MNIVEKLLRNVPATWTCVICGKESIYAPGYEWPVAIQFRKEPMPDGSVKLHVSGDICKDCAPKGEAQNDQRTD